jgi:hypothetical protein
MTGRALTPLLLLASLAACGSQPPSRENEATVNACRQRADAIYDKQNRGEVFFPNSQGSSPFSSSGAIVPPDAGLSQLKQRDDTINDCLRGSVANTGTVPVGPTANANPPAPH